MPKMLPRSLTSVDGIPPGEKQIFQKLASDTTIDNWTVIFRQEITAMGQRDGEIDFLILAPNLGVLVLEIKSHRKIERRNGLWYLGGDPPTSESPFRILNDKRYKLKRWINENGGSNFNALPVARLLVFTNANLSHEVRDVPDWINHEVADATDLINYGIVNLIYKAYSGNEMHDLSAGRRHDTTGMSAENIRRLELLMQPDFVGIESSGIRRAHRDAELVPLIAQQYAVIRSARQMPRILVDGYAGTGKTNLAIHTARELQSEEYQVGVFCFNSNLGEHLKLLTSSDKFAWVGTVDAFARQHVGPDMLTASPPDFAAIRTEALLRIRQSDTKKFDAVVIDEGQDLYAENNLELVDIIDASLKGGLSNGTFRMFADFESQQIFARKNDAALVASRALVAGNPTVLEMRTNCRNPRMIGRIAALAGALEPGYEGYLRAGGVDDIRFINSNSRSDQLDSLAIVLSELKTMGVAPSEIVILSMCPSKDSVAYELASQ
jgi:Ni2+-binding GTPase involved in maturation of urease and hydrogenase